MRVRSLIEIFVCFASEDEKLYKGLERQLQAASRHRSIVWYSNEMSAGTDWKAESEAHLQTAHIILLLVSPAFMASDYHYLVQMKQAMDRHKQGEAIVIPIILRPTDWQSAPFGKLKALPADAVPITDGRWRTQDEAFFDVVKGVLEVMKALDMKINETKKRKGFSTSDMLYKTTSSHEKLPWRMLLCPSCIEEFYPNECDIVSALDRRLIEPGKTGRLEKRGKPKPLMSPEYRELQACRECPRCGYLLPYNIELVDDNISIAVIGEIASGKSVYLASLLHHMKEQWVNSSSLIHMKCLTKDIEEYFNHEYLIPIFGENRVVSATPFQNATEMHPLIYELTSRAVSKNQEKRVNLIFYDGSGEDYALQNRMEQFARYVLRASAIIFLVDPASIPEMSSRLPDHLQYPGGTATESTAYHFLTSTIELLEEYYPSALSSIPLAVMLSKSDLLNYVYGPKVPPFK